MSQFGLPSAFGFKLTRNKGGGVAFSYDQFMASQADGAAYDFTKIDRLFREPNGPTPADDATEVIGLALEGRQWSGRTYAAQMALQPEKMPNGDFSSSDVSAWTRGFNNVDATLAVVGGQLVFTKGAGDGANPLYALPVTTFAAGKFSVLSVGAVGGTAGDRRTGVTAGSDGTGSLTGILSSSTGIRYFLTTATTQYVFLGMIGASTGQTLIVDNLSIKDVPGNHSTQSTANFKPQFQAAGAKFDGSDDRLQTIYGAGSGDNFAIARATVPASLVATQILFGGQDAGSNAIYAGVTTGGALRVRVGTTTVDSTGIDLRNGEHVLGLWIDGTTFYLYADGAIVGSGTWAGSIPSTQWMLGALNNNGTAAAFFAGNLRQLSVGRDKISLARANQIQTALLAA